MATTIDLAAVVSAATVAFVLSALILLLLKIWAVVSSHVKFQQRFRGRILFDRTVTAREQAGEGLDLMVPTPLLGIHPLGRVANAVLGDPQEPGSVRP